MNSSRFCSRVASGIEPRHPADGLRPRLIPHVDNTRRVLLCRLCQTEQRLIKAHIGTMRRAETLKAPAALL
jgi:hypothetical protein